jgi:uncharacterized protein YwgA
MTEGIVAPIGREKKSTHKTAISDRIAKLEQQIATKKAQIEKLNADIKIANEKISELRKKQQDRDFDSLRKVIESKGYSLEDVAEMLQ